MKLIKSDHDRRIEIPGVAEPVQRPVDIDRSHTDFETLRSLRIYRFEAGSTINGHAEEDEVLVLVMAGSVEFTVSEDPSGQQSRSFTLSAPGSGHSGACLAYLPPHSAYQLIAKSEAEVAYARATPASGPPAAVFSPANRTDAATVTVLLEETTYSRRLRLRLIAVKANENDADCTVIEASEASYEALVHVRTAPPQGAAAITSRDSSAMPLESWDTVALNPGEYPTLHVSKRSEALVLVVLAL